MDHKFRYSFCLPDKVEEVEKGEAPKDKVLNDVKSFPWIEELKKMDEVDEIYQSPSVAIENTATQHSLVISITGEPGEHEFQVFYNRPDAFMSEKDGLTFDEMIETVTALLDHNIEALDKKFA